MTIQVANALLIEAVTRDRALDFWTAEGRRACSSLFTQWEGFAQPRSVSVISSRIYAKLNINSEANPNRLPRPRRSGDTSGLLENQKIVERNETRLGLNVSEYMYTQYESVRDAQWRVLV